MENALLSVIDVHFQFTFHEPDVQDKAVAHDTRHRHGEPNGHFDEGILYRKHPLAEITWNDMKRLTMPVLQSKQLTRYVRKML